jgi:hypothetical protein
MDLGVALVAIAMKRLGRGESVGKETTGLQQAGLYCYSRNPQIVDCGSFWFFELWTSANRSLLCMNDMGHQP